ncbi:F-ATPase subunit 6 [Bacteroidales bacterium Barb4]|nr:F-ATPase subunit 6 [Bacteroidales bacterium Barb4]
MMIDNVAYKLFGRPFRTFLSALPLTPHSASLHVGLKSAVPSGLLRMLLTLVLLLSGSIGTARASEEDGGVNPKEVIFGHVTDAYDWHIATVGGHHVSIPLPVIVRSADRGWFLFSSSRLAHGESYEGFHISHDLFPGKVAERTADGSEVRPLDLSFTKNACSLFLSAALLLTVFLGMARNYRREPLKGRGGFLGVLEMLFLFIYDDLIKPCVGKDYRKYAPYLLTVFFFIFFNNLLGLIPVFPGGANVTGNIAITLVLAVLTFLITNLSGTKEYWKEIFWPDVPTWLKVPIPLMPLIEIIGILTKPFALMMRLFANMLAGHMVVLVLVTLIFIFTAMWGGIAGGPVAVVSVLFSIFMIVIDVLVCFIQAYVFTMLSAIFIGLARVEPHHVKK